jgi:hypothetical protein
MKAGTYFIHDSTSTRYILVQDCGGYNFVNLEGYYLVFSTPLSLEQVYESIRDLKLEIF